MAARLTTAPPSAWYGIVDFTSSGLTHVNEEYPKAPNRYRVAGPYIEESFGLVVIDWQC